MSKLNQHQADQLQAIIQAGNAVVEIIINDDSRFYIYTSFEPSFKGSSTSLPYCQLKGIEITSFIDTVRSVLNIRAYMQTFQTYIEAKEALNIKFNEVIPYFIYS